MLRKKILRSLYCKNKKSDVTKSIKPTNLTFSSNVSNSPSFVAINPTIPAGIVAKIIFKQ